MSELLLFYKLPNAGELYYRIAVEIIDMSEVKDLIQNPEKLKPKSSHKQGTKNFDDMVKQVRGSSDMLVIGENLDKIDYKLSPCCNPIPVMVFRFITVSEGIKIHRTNCPNAIQLMSKHACRSKGKMDESEATCFSGRSKN